MDNGSDFDDDESGTAQRVDVGLAWALKRSFVEYVAGMRDGRMTLEGDAALTSMREFYFPLLSSERDAAGTHISRFSGGLRFIAHHGLLSVPIHNPELQITDDHGSILIDGEDGGRFVIADLAAIESAHDHGVQMWRCDDVRLSEAAVDLFGGTYGAGELLAPLTARVPAH